jgi:hypothetical protein
MVHGPLRGVMLVTFLATSLGMSGHAQEPVCGGGFGSFKSDFETGVTVSVGAAQQAGFATRMCSAKLEWEKQKLLVVPSAWQVDLDAMGIDLGLGVPVATFQIKRTDVERFATYKIYSLKRAPQQLRTITGGDDYSAADTDMDGKVEIWTHDAAAIDGFDNISALALEFAPMVVLRFEQKKLIEVNTEFLPVFDRQIAILRGELTAQDLDEFKQSNGTLITDSFVPAEKQHRLIAAKTRILQIVWSYLYSGREEEAWKNLSELWPTPDVERVRTFMLQARARGIRAQVEGVSQRPPRSRFKKADIFPPRSNTIPTQGDPISLSYAPETAGQGKGPHDFEVDANPIPILLRRPPPVDPSDAAMKVPVNLDLVIDCAGKVRTVKAKGQTDLDPVSYTGDWKFIPAFKGGKPVATYMHLAITPTR